MRMNNQVEDSKKLLNLFQQQSSLNDPLLRDTIYNFTKEYSSIATERILNYHLSTKNIDMRAIILIYPFRRLHNEILENQ